MKVPFYEAGDLVGCLLALLVVLSVSEQLLKPASGLWVLRTFLSSSEARGRCDLFCFEALEVSGCRACLGSVFRLRFRFLGARGSVVLWQGGCKKAWALGQATEIFAVV